MPARNRLVVSNADRSVNPQAVAEKIRDTHVLATTVYGDVIQPTAIIEEGGTIHRVQRLLPIDYPSHPSEQAIRATATYSLFEKLRERWTASLTSSDLRSLPPDVQDYWKTFPPDHGLGTNVIFLGLDRLRVIDY